MRQSFPLPSLFAALIIAISGMLFGYNTSIISGVLLFITDAFQLTTFQEELVVSTLLIGALIGALFGGVIADRIGRKKTLFVTIFVLLAGILMLMKAEGFSFLLWGRFISGLAVGIISLTAPLYIAEMSPASHRGALVSLNQLFITIGILLAYVVAYLYGQHADWRAMFSFSLIFLSVQFVGLFFVPESPYWLLDQERIDAAGKIAAKMRIEVKGGKEKIKAHWSTLFQPKYRLPFFIGIGIASAQTITGINTVIYYAPRIFEHAGYSVATTALLATVLVGVVNFIMTVISLWLIDWLGRRFLLIGGLIGMGISLVLLGAALVAKLSTIAVVCMLLYVSFFALSLGPVAWLLISEIYPMKIRGRAMGVASFFNWTSNYLVSLTFLTLIQTLGPAGTFWLYAAICALALWFVCRLVPETKGKTFEQIQSFWEKP